MTKKNTTDDTHPPLEELLDVKQTAKILNIAVKTLRDHVLHRRIEYVKLRGRILFRPSQVWEFVKKAIVPPFPDAA